MKIAVWGVRMLFAALVAWPAAVGVERTFARGRGDGGVPRLALIGARTSAAFAALAAVTVVVFMAYAWAPLRTRPVPVGLWALDALMQLWLTGLLAGLLMSARATALGRARRRRARRRPPMRAEVPPVAREGAGEGTSAR